MDALKYDISYFKEIDSTNAYALRNLDDLVDRQVISATVQTEGRGRFNRKWISDKAGNVYLSIVLKPCGNELPLANLTQYLSVVACKTFETYYVKPEIKWPNDVLVGGKKIAGILSQSKFQGSELKGIVLGIGVNLNLTEQDLDKIDQSATSLNLLTGNPAQKDEFIKKLLDKFFESYESFLEHGFSFIKEDYVARNCFLNKELTVNLSASSLSGVIKEIKADGSIVLLDNKMRENHISAGDISY